MKLAQYGKWEPDVKKILENSMFVQNRRKSSMYKSADIAKDMQEIVAFLNQCLFFS